jgi:hypothetical protein
MIAMSSLLQLCPKHTTTTSTSTSTTPEQDESVGQPTQQPTTDYFGPRCCVRGCKVRGHQEELIKCEGPHCDKSLHMTCYIEKVIKDKRELFDKLEDHKVVCTKVCLTKAVSQNSPKLLTWENDGSRGTEDTNTSAQILIKWMVKQGNYSHLWKGGKQYSGQSKDKIAAAIAADMNAAGVKVKRNGKQVVSKIQHLERQFKVACDFANKETSAKLKENDFRAFEDQIKKRCRYYFDLEPIMSDQTSAGPNTSSYDKLDSDSDSDSNDDSENDKVQIMMSRRKKGEDDEEENEKDNADDDNVIDDDYVPLAAANATADEVPDTPTVPMKRRQKTPNTTTITQSTKKKKTKVIPKPKNDCLAMLWVEQKHLVKAKIAKLNGSLAADNAYERGRLLQMCEDMVRNHPNWSKERILQFFPEYGPIIDLVMG